MNTNTAVVGGIIVVLLVLGGIFFYTQSNPSPAVTPTGTTTDDGTGVPAPAVAQPGVPAATTAESAAVADTAASVTGGVVPNGASTVYWYEYGTTANLGSKTSNQNLGSGYINLPAPAYLSGLAKNTTYYFTLVAQNQYGKSTGVTYSFRTTTGTPAPQGSAPSVRTLTAGDITRTSATLSGQATPNKAATQAWFEYGTTRDLGGVTQLQSIGSGSVALTNSMSVSGLQPATTYYYRLNAQNEFGTVNGTLLTFTTLGPAITVGIPVVTTQVATAATTTATLRGTVNPSGSQTNYWFEYSTDSSFGAAAQKTTSQHAVGAGAATVSVQTDITGLRSGTTYYYHMVAHNSAGTVTGDRITFRTK